MTKFVVVFLLAVFVQGVINEPLFPEAEADWMSEGHMILDEEQLRQLNDSSSERNAVIGTDRLWPNGVIPTLQAENVEFSFCEQTRFEKAFKKFSENSCIKLVPRTNEESYLYLTRDGAGCSSMIGRNPEGGVVTTLNLGTGCADSEDNIIHLFTHAAGVYQHTTDDINELNKLYNCPSTRGSFTPPKEGRPEEIEKLLTALFGETKSEDDWMSAEGDMILDEEQLRQFNDSSSERQARRDSKYLWPNGIIPVHVADPTQFSSCEFRQMNLAAKSYEENSCVKLVLRTNEESYVNLIRGGMLECSSDMGRQETPNFMSLGARCAEEWKVIHEFMHAAGFIHEFMRSDRDEYIKVMYDNIIPKNLHNFIKTSTTQTRNLGPYDYNSVMHYGAYSAAIDPTKKTIQRLDGSDEELGNKKGFSQIDIRKLNKLYKCKKNNHKTTT